MSNITSEFKEQINQMAIKFQEENRDRVNIRTNFQYHQDNEDKKEPVDIIFTYSILFKHNIYPTTFNNIDELENGNILSKSIKEYITKTLNYQINGEIKVKAYGDSKKNEETGDFNFICHYKNKDKSNDNIFLEINCNMPVGKTDTKKEITIKDIRLLYKSSDYNDMLVYKLEEIFNDQEYLII